MNNKNITATVAVTSLLICIIIPDLRDDFRFALPPVLNTLVLLQSSGKGDENKNGKRHQ